MTDEKRKSVKVKTPVFRVSYPNLFEPKSFENSESRYSVTCIVPKDFDDGDHPDPKGDNARRMKRMREAVEEVGLNAFGEEKWKRVKKQQYGTPFRDGEEREGKDGYGEDVEFFVAKSKDRPGVVNRKRIPITAEDIPAGHYAIATMVVYAYTKGKGGVALALNNVQHIAEGEMFGSRSRPEDDFEEWDDDDDDDDDI